MSDSYTTTLAAIVAGLSNQIVSDPTSDNDTVPLSFEDARQQISDVTADSRAVQQGALFVAVQGATSDGHRYIPQALATGAVAVIGARPRDELAAEGIDIPQTVPYILIEDARLALAQAAAAFYGYPSRELTVIGVTGTDGKTTTCTVLESILVEATRSDEHPNGRVGVITTVGARVLGVEQETGFHVTTPDSPDVQRYLAQMRDAGCTYAVVETTSHGLAQQRVAAVDYNVAAVTNITHEHLDYHGTRDAYVQAKALLYRSLFHSHSNDNRPRFAVLNRDDEGSYGALVVVMHEESAHSETDIETLVYSAEVSTDSNADVVAADIMYSPSATMFDIICRSKHIPIETTLIGQFNVQNILCAASVALGLGIEPSAVQQGVKSLPGIIGRMERIDHGQSFLAIVDFAHSPVSLERALQTLRPLVTEDEDGQPGRLIAVFGCAGLRDRQKRKLMGEVSGRLSDYTVVTAEDPRTENVDDINREIESGLKQHVDRERYTIIPDRSEAILHAVRIAKAGDVVVAFGKGHERSMCFGTTEYPWSDQEAMQDALKARESADE